MSAAKKKQTDRADRESAEAKAELESSSMSGGPGSIKIRQRDVAAAAYVYMLLPVAVFLLTWLKLWLGVLLLAVLGYGFIRIVKGDYYAGKTMCFRWESLFLLAAAICLWCWLAGQGGWYFQTWDNHYRNAIFRDLITHEWPVIYEADGSALVYYLMQWILPALVGKAFGWTAANAALFAWDALGIMIALVALLFYLKKSDTKRCLLVALLFMCWGGLHLFGEAVNRDVIFDIIPAGDNWSYPWFDRGYQYSANITLLQWVYNQSIVPWVAVSLLLLAPRVDTFMFLGFCVLPYAPLPFVGFVLLMLGIGLWELAVCIREKAPKRFFREAFSVPNLAALFTLFPVFGAYFGCNSATTGANGVGGIGLYVPLSSFDGRRIFAYVLFLTLEFGIYAILIGQEYKREPLFLLSVISLTFIPLFRVGEYTDFCMRASIPALSVLFALVVRYLLENWKDCKTNARITLLIICLTFSSCNLINSLGDATSKVYHARTFSLPADVIGSLENYPLELIQGELLDYVPYGNFNFCCFDPEEHIFYEFMAK